ncbi:hypothetical protein C7999DRAFT_44289 [Corynascus novoguineensis]|uniref:Zn(2)-C6 fungal-type domain-containing protein n=1 Tax=Corynascus novoguineensis TaxID=1126955 RepID=A0AAN7CKV7_9PEZI|nr:hypothetical protein C7999DRAFT_44289 [Corynascus novoguineensis]
MLSPSHPKCPEGPLKKARDISTPRTAARKIVRTRTGCWACRRRRKKCNELRPICSNCSRNGEACEWGVRLSFRDENILTIPQNRPSLRQDLTSLYDGGPIRVVNITDEVIRDYWSEIRAEDDLCENLTNRTMTTSDNEWRDSNGVMTSDICSSNNGPADAQTPHSQDIIQLAAAQLLDLGAGEPSVTTSMMGSGPSPTHLGDLIPPLSSVDNDTSATADAGISPESLFADDGIFLPGSTYFELHSALRNHIFDTARSACPSLWPSPCLRPSDVEPMPETNAQGISDTAAMPPNQQPEQAFRSSDSNTPAIIELSKQEEYALWKNWVDEIAPWLDKFDRDCHFQQKLPALANIHPHLRSSMLALSARQLERKHPERSSSASLALYQEAVHQLVPQLQTKLTDVVASCVVLCVLEMMSCSPQMWRRHLDGCACLIRSLGMNGFSGGLEQALFWCFTRMDVCGGLISSESTLIPTAEWTPKMSLTEAVELFHRTPGADMYANFVVFLCAQALELFACDDPEAEYTRRWSELFGHIERWYAQRPPDMHAVLSQPANAKHEAVTSGSPFPTLLFSNPPAISGNQLYHTAALLMLQKRPRRAVLPPATRPILWHARRICAISICNTHHGCWTNSVQPLWIAGQVMSHPAEHRAIMNIYQRIQNETGWGANWRAEDLKAHWSQLDGD